MNRTQTQGVIEFSIGHQHFLNREEVRFITLETFNTMSDSHYRSTQELMFNPISVETEISVRSRLMGCAFSTSAIIVVDTIPSEKLTLTLESKIYEDTKEQLIILRE
jgi:hypothetical protein